MATDYRKQMEEAARIAQGGAPAIPSVATPVAAPAPQVQPQIISTTPSASPRTPDAQAAYLASAAPQQQPQIVSTIPGTSPRTPDAQAAYLAPQQPVSVAAPAAVPAGGAVQVPQGVLDPGAAVRGDIADAYRRGAQSSTATGVGMAANEAVISPVSRVGGGLMDAGLSVARGAGNAAMAVGRPLVEGVRAFLTGRPPAPSVAAPAAPVAGTPEPLIRQPAPGFDANGQRTGVAPTVAAAPAAVAPAARQPVTIDAATGQPIVANGGASPGYQPGTVQPIFQQGSMSVYQQGNHRVIVGDNPAPVRVAQPSVAAVPHVQPPAQVTAVPGRRASGRSALGGFMGTAAGLSVARGQNNINQRDFKNQVSVAKLGMESAKTEADVGRAKADTKRIEAENRDREQLTTLRTQLVNETDPKKRAAIERKITTLQGKAAPKYQVVTVKTVDPATGGQIETPYLLDEAGNSRPVVQQGGQAVTVEGAKAAVAKGANKDEVNKRLQAAGLPTL
jgi:hypothetical protein